MIWRRAAAGVGARVEVRVGPGVAKPVAVLALTLLPVFAEVALSAESTAPVLTGGLMRPCGIGTRAAAGVAAAGTNGAVGAAAEGVAAAGTNGAVGAAAEGVAGAGANEAVAATVAGVGAAGLVTAGLAVTGVGANRGV